MGAHDLPSFIGDPSIFAVAIELDEDYGGEWLFGRFSYVIGNVPVGDYSLKTSLGVVLAQMHWIMRDAHSRSTARFFGKSKEAIFRTISETLYGTQQTGFEEIAEVECWAKHNISLPIDVLDDWRIYQCDEPGVSRVIWARSDDVAVNETRMPRGTTETVFESLYSLLNGLYDSQVQPSDPDRTE